MTHDGATYSLHYDQVGSLRVVADATGNVIKTISYTSFGNILSDSNLGFKVPIGFAGGLHDRDTGLVRLGFRDYDPETGRFTALDPIGAAGGDNDWYGYCLDDPINAIDPLGLQETAYSRWLDGQHEIKKSNDSGCSCASIDVGTSGLGGYVETGIGLCWDDGWTIRPMFHADIGASSGWGIEGKATYQTTNAANLSDLEGASNVVGKSLDLNPLKKGASPSIGIDFINTPDYNGTAYSAGGSIGIGGAFSPNRLGHQNTWIWGD